MTNKLEPILEFIVLDENEAPVLNEQGLPTLKQGPIAKPLGELIAKGKISNIDIFAKLQAQKEQWDWARDYCDYLVELNRVTEFNANLPEPITNDGDDDDGMLNEVNPLPEPMAPDRPALRTIEQVLEPYAKKLEKLKGVSFKGISVSLTEDNQNGLSSLKSALELAKEFDAKDQFFPINFRAETPDGFKTLELVSEEEFKEFGFKFILGRKSLFG